jgi:hypothetical protein
VRGQPGSIGAESSRAAWGRWAAAIAISVAVLLGASALAPHVALSPFGAFGIGFGAISACVIVASGSCPATRGRELVGACAFAVPLAALAVWSPPWSALAVACVVMVGLLGATTILGAVVGSTVAHPGHLLLVALVSSAADVASVMHPAGPSAVIAESEAALTVLALSWPMLGTTAIEPMLGGGDVVFAALYFAAARKHRLSLGRTALALGLGFALSLACVMWLERALPALPFLGATIVALHPQARRVPAADRVRGSAAAAVMIAAVTVLLLLR